jgi:addiction module HigA family antidote
MMPMRLTRYRVAKEIGVSPQRIGDIVSGKRSISADTDLRLCTSFGLTAGYFSRAQLAFYVEVATDKMQGELARITPWQHEVA